MMALVSGSCVTATNGLHPMAQVNAMAQVSYDNLFRRSPSPKNGNISNIRRRLSAISLRKESNAADM
jgi:hypothetical protein